MKYIFPILIIFTIALRPVLPLINYAVNYDFIVENLCENKAKPELMCNGKCYVSKELAKTTQEQGNNGQKIVIPFCDVFVVVEELRLSISSFDFEANSLISIFQADFYDTNFSTRLFRPPLV